MVPFLYQYLATMCGWKVHVALGYCSTRMMLAALTSLLVTIFAGPRVIKKLYEMKTGQSIRVEDCPMLVELHQKKKGTPTMGGILILFSVLISLVLWMDLSRSLTWMLAFSTVWLGCVGGWDDYLKLKERNSKGLSGKKKLLLQVLLGGIVCLYLYTSDTQSYMGQYYVPFFKEPVVLVSGLGLIVGALFSVFVITGSSNAVNLTDGLDGLASGCLVLVSAVLALFAFFSNNVEIAHYLNILYIEGSSEVAVYLFALVGAVLGFLWYNGYPAQVFMGDTGSLALGGMLGICAIVLRREVLLALVGGIFVAEAVSVILQVSSYRWRNCKRVFLCAPLHHHFEYKGWPETKVVLRFWIVSLILAIVGVASLKLQ